MDPVYFDHAATTPVLPEVFQAMEPYFCREFANPSSLYSPAQKIRSTMQAAREKVASLIHASPGEIFFTGGGSEADNLAIKGVAFSLMEQGKHIITSSIEHHAVLHTCAFLEKKLGFTITYLPVDKEGLVDLDDLKESITPETILISIMMANNEVGTIQPIQSLAQLANEQGIPFHTDGVQAVGSIPVNVEELGVSLLSLSAHKFNGPKGVGALYVKKGTKISSLIHGGAQEGGLRAGTENIPAIVGLGAAAYLAEKHLPRKEEEVSSLRDRMIEGIEREIYHVVLNGHRTLRLPGNVNFSFRYVEGEAMLLHLDMKGIAASSGSACTSGSLSPSHVLTSMGLSHELAQGSLRLSLGFENTEEEVDYLLEVLPGIVHRLREMSPLYKATP